MFIWTQFTIKYMRFACRIPKATDTHSEYVMFARFFFFREHWLRERAPCYVTRACNITEKVSGHKTFIYT